MLPVDKKRQEAGGSTARVLAGIAKRFMLHLRLAREMRQDGYLILVAEKPEYTLNMQHYTHEGRIISNISLYYGVSDKKLIALYNAGYINLDGLAYKKQISRYLQQHAGRLSVRLLCYLAYDELRPGGGVVKDQNACDCLSVLKIDGRLNPPKDLNMYLDAACRGQPAALEHVARWMRDLIENVGKPHGWAFYGVRLALVEGSYVLWNRPVPKLRRLRKHRKLAKLLREHPLLRECVTPVARSGRNSDYTYVYHRPGEFWDL